MLSSVVFPALKYFSILSEKKNDLKNKVFEHKMCIFIYIYTISQQMHCSDNLLISYSSHIFRRMYVIISEPSVMRPAELHECAYCCIIYVKESIHPVVIVNNKTCKIPTVKSL
jgi:hypothetical protein